MAEDVRMEEQGSSGVSPKSLYSARTSPCATTDILHDGSTDSSENSPNGSRPTTPKASPIPNVVPESINGNIYHPYAIEEPPDDDDGDEKLSSSVRRLELPCLPDSFERWQRDLVDYMDGLGDGTSKSLAARPYEGQARGQKRKSANTAGVGQNCAPQFPFSKLKSRTGEPPFPVPGLTTKRLRRRSKLPGDAIKPAPRTSLHDFREAEPNRSSSSEMGSTDSSTDTVDESAVVDEMEID